MSLTAPPLGRSEMGTLTIEHHIVVPEVLPLLVPLGILVQHDPQRLSGEDQGHPHRERGQSDSGMTPASLPGPLPSPPHLHSLGEPGNLGQRETPQTDSGRNPMWSSETDNTAAGWKGRWRQDGKAPTGLEPTHWPQTLSLP